MSHSNTHQPAWSRHVERCDSLDDFLWARRSGRFDDDEGDPPTTATICDGFEPHPLLAAPGDRRKSTMISGEIRNGRGYHPMATFVDCALTRTENR